MSTKQKYTYEYPMFSFAVDILVCFNNKILFIKRKKDPFKDCLALPGGFVNIDETCEDAAIRELFEETNIKIAKHQITPYMLLDEPKRDSRGRVISRVYKATVEEKHIRNAQGGDDAHKELQWISIDELEKYDYAFDHYKVLLKFLKNH